jgi:hypothetical protein
VLISHSLAARAAGNRLLLIVDPALPRHWRCDPCLLRQLLDNLIGNAVEATRSGAIHIEALAESSGRGPYTSLTLRISDTGPGIDEALGQRVFDAYQRGAGSESAGRGLGLFICRNIVRAMGGRIRWSNLDEGGACFELSLPKVVVPAPRAPVPAPRLLRAINCRLRLEGPVRESVTALLDRLGVGWTPDGLERAGRRRFEVLVEEQAPGPGEPGPNLLLSVVNPRGAAPSELQLRAPILEGTLGPALLQLALEEFSAPGAGRG